jgi:hypothetical protein
MPSSPACDLCMRQCQVQSNATASLIAGSGWAMMSSMGLVPAAGSGCGTRLHPASSDLAGVAGTLRSQRPHSCAVTAPAAARLQHRQARSEHQEGAQESRLAVAASGSLTLDRWISRDRTTCTAVALAQLLWCAQCFVDQAAGEVVMAYCMSAWLTSSWCIAPPDVNACRHHAPMLVRACKRLHQQRYLL